MHAGELSSRRCSWVWFTRGLLDRIGNVCQGGYNGSVAVTMVGPQVCRPWTLEMLPEKNVASGVSLDLRTDMTCLLAAHKACYVSQRFLPNRPACEFEGRASANLKGVGARR